MLERNYQAFFALLRAGLWESRKLGVGIESTVDWGEVYRVANEQAVMGLIAAGMEQVQEGLVPKAEALKFAAYALQVEQRNRAMNEFVASLIDKLRGQGVNPVLVKGQGIAQCYDRPLWRACGDVDLLFNGDDYEKAKKILLPLASDTDTEYTHFKHLLITIDGWAVELHGTLHTRLSRRVDRQIDAIQQDTFQFKRFRTWPNGGVDVSLPAPDNDIIFVFTHILHHFFFEGIGVRQICDWCRLLWTYHDEIDTEKLQNRLSAMGIMSEWKAFAAYAVEYLGMPVDAMPMYSEAVKWHKKAARINVFILKVGNFGHKQLRDYTGMTYLRRKFKSFWGRLSDMLRHFPIFPKDSIAFFGGVLRSGLHAALRGE